VARCSKANHVNKVFAVYVFGDDARIDTGFDQSLADRIIFLVGENDPLVCGNAFDVLDALARLWPADHS